MKNIFYILISLFFVTSLFSCSSGGDRGNGEFHSENYHFKVEFPGKPKVNKEEEAADGFFIQTISYDNKESGYMVVAGRMNDLYAEVYEGNENELSISVRDATIENLGASLTKDENIDFKNHSANYYEAKGTLKGKDFFIKGINIVNENFVFVVIVFRESKQVTDKEYNDFVNSFEFVN